MRRVSVHLSMAQLIKVLYTLSDISAISYCKFLSELFHLLFLLVVTLIKK